MSGFTISEAPRPHGVLEDAAPLDERHNRCDPTVRSHPDEPSPYSVQELPPAWPYDAAATASLGRKDERMPQDLDALSIDTIRTLAMDAVQKANSGHPG